MTVGLKLWERIGRLLRFIVSQQHSKQKVTMRPDSTRLPSFHYNSYIGNFVINTLQVIVKFNKNLVVSIITVRLRHADNVWNESERTFSWNKWLDYLLKTFLIWTLTLFCMWHVHPCALGESLCLSGTKGLPIILTSSSHLLNSWSWIQFSCLIKKYLQTNDNLYASIIDVVVHMR